MDSQTLKSVKKPNKWLSMKQMNKDYKNKNKEAFILRADKVRYVKLLKNQRCLRRWQTDKAPASQ